MTIAIQGRIELQKAQECDATGVDKGAKVGRIKQLTG